MMVPVSLHDATPHGNQVGMLLFIKVQIIADPLKRLDSVVNQPPSPKTG
ncbi:MAG: hypothetical protein IPP41_09675 [Rhodocyclaceae bacterium]|nr:hypothetical protein [Rhodocyclaceae bacterium]